MWFVLLAIIGVASAAIVSEIKSPSDLPDNYDENDFINTGSCDNLD